MIGQSVIIEVDIGDKVQVFIFLLYQLTTCVLHNFLTIIKLRRNSCNSKPIFFFKFKVYMFTATGLHDKPNNYQTQFAGVLLRPKDFMKELSGETPPALTNGHAK